MAKLSKRQKMMISAYVDNELKAGEQIAELLIDNAQARQWLCQIQLQKQKLAAINNPLTPTANFASRVSLAVSQQQQLDKTTASKPKWQLNFFSANRLLPAAALLASFGLILLTSFNLDAPHNSKHGQPLSATADQHPATELAAEYNQLSEQQNAQLAQIEYGDNLVVKIPTVGDYGQQQATWHSENAQQQLDRYLLEHSEYAIASGYNSVVPYMRLAGYAYE